MPPSPPLAPQPVPAADALRRAALQASWRRDRRVGRRRVVWRWTLWALRRYVAPAAAPLALVFAGWWWWSNRDATPDPVDRTSAPLAASAPSSAVESVAGHAPAAAEAAPPAARAGLRLRMDWPAASTDAALPANDPGSK